MIPIGPSQPRNTERCPQCSYLLLAHPDAGRCPECGQAYDQSHIVIDGWLAGQRAFGNVYLSRTPLTLLASVMINAAIVVFILIEYRGAMRSMAALPVIVPIACYYLSRTVQRDSPPVQLILSPMGRTHRHHPAANSTAVRYLINIAAIAPLPLLFATHSPEALFGFFIGSVAAVLISVVVCLAWYRFRRPARPSPLASVSGQQLALAPWGPGDEIILRPTRPCAWRITVGHKPRKRRTFRLTSDPYTTVHFDADLPPERVEHIAAQITSWPVKLTFTRHPPRPTWLQRLFRRSEATQRASEQGS